MKLKETLNLGKTAFPMRAGLPTKEPVWQKEWEDAKLYQRRQELNEGNRILPFMMALPMLTEISTWTCYEQSQKISIVRSKSMSGFTPLIFQVGIPMVCQLSKSWLNKV